MPLTKDRPNVTASALNALWASLIAKVAPTLPTPIRDPNGDGSSVFDSIDLDESDPEAFEVVSPIDLAAALVSKGNAWGGATWLRTSLDDSISGSRVEVRASYSQTASTFSSSVSARSVLPPAYSSTDLLVAGVAGLTITASRVVSGAPDGWGLATAIGGVETFEGLGYASWGPGEVGLITEIERFDGVGLGEWRPGSVFLVGEVEAGWAGWPEGTEPVVPSDAVCLAVSDLTSQVDGVRTSFVVPESYESGSLRVYLNGQRLSGSMVTETSSTTFDLSEVLAEVGDALVVDYCAC
jgi:hypothetical protein